MTDIPVPAPAAAAAPSASGLPAWLSAVHPAWWILGFLLLFMPAMAGDFVLVQIFGWSFILGMIALSLMFLGGYGGMVSLAQMTIAALAGYMAAVFGTSSVAEISLGLPWWIAVPIALSIATLFGVVVGALAVRTAGIYTIMITLAISAAFFYFALQNYEIFNGQRGFNGIRAPVAFGVDWRAPVPFYYLTLALAAASYLFVVYVGRAPFGLALQGIRDNARRMAAIGYNVTAHRIAAYAVASFIAGVAGILLTWQNGQISPGTAGIPAVIDILVIAVVGGLGHPIGPFLGALLYALLRTFALDVFSAFGFESTRFNLLVGVAFLVVVLASPDGLVGLWRRWRDRRRPAAKPSGGHR
ncbi:branched-chain amino acid ABC transporter permease [Chthonobacter rhizosphaerae]|uniref:branched-chain amino acid ABC transporter permease n=1 Tax=Chthonobacter rhizosphaerae TaxID=2735553 RepID=UPI0015EEB672|nr:branched-chain amino acid ABC transporter permease [Chthonobacter rhizosphaerae]